MLFSVLLSLGCLFMVEASPKMSYDCGGCVLLIGELEKTIKKVDPSKTIQAGSYRVNPKGEQVGLQQVPYARSKTHISEILESACDKSKEYKLAVNPLTGKAVFVQKDSTYLKGDESSSIRAKLHNACNDLVDSNEDEIIKFLGTEREDNVKAYCQEELGLCTSIDMSPLPPDEPEDEVEEDGTNDEL
ncbi:unnamed protein product [Auanema sp. JU1783]|nr:unnamed protein product [Auanema sp. JU1783]